MKITREQLKMIFECVDFVAERDKVYIEEYGIKSGIMVEDQKQEQILSNALADWENITSIEIED